jgi:hypothetical protein
VRAASFVRAFALASLLGSLAACTPVGLIVGATGVATDTSVTWDVVKHIHGKLTENDATPCVDLNSVQRALNARCSYQPGSIRRADVARTGLQECPLAIATRDPRLWRALPELLEKGARLDACPGSPLLALAASDACPDFAAAAPEVRDAIRTIAEDDPRAVRHDVFRMLSCPRARAVGLDRVLATWLDRGDLEPGKLSFSPLGALDPDLLVSRFGRELEVAGHRPEAALDGYEGVLPTGYELALRSSHWPAIDWWLYRLPRLANLAPPQRGGLPWVPLQKVLVAGFLQRPETQGEMVVFLMARGASPAQTLPSDPRRTVATFAAQMKSPMLSVLEPKTARSGSGAAIAAFGATAAPTATAPATGR